jgi:hypothetical protein
MRKYRGIPYILLKCSPPTWVRKSDRQTPASPAGQACLSKAFYRTSLLRAGKQPPGRPRKVVTVGERRLDMLNQGKSIEDIAAEAGLDCDAIERSMRRGRRRRGQ